MPSLTNEVQPLRRGASSPAARVRLSRFGAECLYGSPGSNMACDHSAAGRANAGHFAPRRPRSLARSRPTGWGGPLLRENRESGAGWRRAVAVRRSEMKPEPCGVWVPTLAMRGRLWSNRVMRCPTGATARPLAELRQRSDEHGRWLGHGGAEAGPGGGQRRLTSEMAGAGGSGAPRVPRASFNSRGAAGRATTLR